LFGKGVVLSQGRIASVDVILHKLIEVLIGTVEYIDAAGGDLAIDSCELPVNDVIPHEQCVLPGPVPRGVKSTCFEGIEGREDTVNVEIAVFAVDGV
jgi:hypothetical protein